MALYIDYDNLLDKVRQIAKTAEFGDCIAVFDLDDTLIIGDIGEALFAQLKKEGFDIPLTWKKYWELIKAGYPGEAYIKMCTCMESISTSYLKSTVNSILDTDENFISFYEDNETINVLVPKPNPMMKTIVDMLMAYNCEVYIISSSHSIAVTIVAGRFFKIEPGHSYGVKNREEEVGDTTFLTSEILEPIPVREGKALVYASRIGSERPYLVFGDSANDTWLFNLARPEGMAVYTGNDRYKFAQISKNLDNNDNFYCLI